jgi:hypothetical protein
LPWRLRRQRNGLEGMAALAREVLCRHGDPGGDDDVPAGGGVVGAGDAQQRQVRSSVTADLKARRASPYADSASTAGGGTPPPSECSGPAGHPHGHTQCPLTGDVPLLASVVSPTCLSASNRAISCVRNGCFISICNALLSY